MLAVPFPWLGVVAIATFLAGRWSQSQGSCGAEAKPRVDVDPAVLPLLYSPPTGHGEVAVPSMNSDARGQIHNFKVGDFRFNVLVSHANTMRSGDVHRSRQLDMIFAGRVQVTTREGGKDIVREYGAGQLVIIPAHVPHLFHFLNYTGTRPPLPQPKSRHKPAGVF